MLAGPTYTTSLLASNLANERRWAATLIQRHVRRRWQARAVLLLIDAAAARAREQDAAYRFAIAAAKQQHEEAMTAVEICRKEELERAKGPIRQLQIAQLPNCLVGLSSVKLFALIFTLSCTVWHSLLLISLD